MRVVILGAGFGGLELATMLSSADESGGFDVVLIDKGDAFVFGYSKLDVMFGRKTLDSVRLPYSAFAKPSVRLLRETVTAIDPEARRVTTDAGAYEADVLVVALGADYDYEATPGLTEFGNEFYSIAGTQRLAARFRSSRAVARSSASAARRTSVRPHRARPPCSSTTSSSRVACATTARSRW